MGVVSAPEQPFPTFQRGEQREDMLASWRNALRAAINPSTGAPFTEEEIAIATAKGSRWWSEADAIDAILLPGQQRGSWLALQVRPDLAGTGALETYHGPIWSTPRLPRTGGSGRVTVTAPVGTTFLGSTVLPDTGAAKATDPSGKRYQLLFSVTTPGDGIAGGPNSDPMVFVAIDGGTETNIAAGTKLTLVAPPPGTAPQAVAFEDFRGGTDDESDRDWGKRIMRAIAKKQAAGNNAHVRGWATGSSNAIEDGFIYACAYHAGSVHIAIVQKRGSFQGREGRIASFGTLALATAYLTPPGSSVFPAPPHVVVTGCVSVPSHMVLSLSLPRGRSSGWSDGSPWPTNDGTTPASVTAITSQTLFRIFSNDPLPVGVTAPRMMVWDDEMTKFVPLAVQSVVSAGGDLYDVTLSSEPAKLISIDDRISPHIERYEILANAVAAYFDSLGPGELVDLTADPRAHRAFRYPEPAEEYPQRAGAGIISWLQDALGGALADSILVEATVTTPPLPTEMIDGPSLIVPGRVGVYAI